MALPSFRRLVQLSPLYLALVVHVGCGGSSGSSGSSSGGGQSLGSVTSVSVAGPAFAQAGRCTNRTATVSGTGNFINVVTWYVNGVAGGNSQVGTI